MKTELISIAHPYATALLELAAKIGKNHEETVLEDLTSINQVLAAVPDFETVLKHPGISSERKKDILSKLFAGKVQELTMRLLQLLSDKRRLNLLPVLESSYRVLLYKRQSITEASLTSTEPLTNEQVKLLKDQLSSKLGMDLRLHLQVDQSLIAGLILKIGDRVIDGSVKGRLNSLRRVLLAG